MTPTEKDAMALAVLRENADPLAARSVDHLASRIAELEAEIETHDADRTACHDAYMGMEARATRAEAELAAVRGLLIEIRGDCEFAYGVSEHNYRQFCDSGAMGRMPSDTWARHCQRRIEQIDAARGGE